MEAEPQTPVALRIDGAVAIVTLNRPEVRNAIDDRTRDELGEILRRIARDNAVRAVVVTGSGSAFCAGGDIGAMRERLEIPAGEVAYVGWRRMIQMQTVFEALYRLPVPTIAAVNGPAAGLGCDLALCCDFIVASAAARFLMSYVLRGLVPDGGGLYYLPRRVGVARAKELIFSGRQVACDEALAIGLADRVVPADRLIAESIAWAASLAERSPAAVAMTKSILGRTFELSRDEVFALTAQAQALMYSTAEHRDAVRAFFDAPAEKKS